MTTTAEIIKRYADNIATVAEAVTPARDLDPFIDQVEAAARNFDRAGINGHEDLETAAIHLAAARNSDDETAREVFLNQADVLLKFVWDMADEYRSMV